MLNNEQELVDLIERNKKATELAIQINTKIEAAKETYEKLSLLAKEKYGTSDLSELKNLLIKIQMENEQKIRDFNAAVSNLENEVKSKQEIIKQIQQS